MARIGFLSTYPPTRCGLATFTDSLASAMAGAEDDVFVVRVTDPSTPDAFDTTASTGPGIARSRVVAELRNGDAWSLSAAIRALNAADVAIVQHEYGIYGGPDGDEVVTVLAGLAVPVIAVLHTVLPDPTPHQKQVLEQVAHTASATVVMTEAAQAILTRFYDVDASRVTVIPHGVPAPTASVNPAISLGHPIVLTWGLLGPGKGIEWGIRAFAQLADLDPRPVYRVLGQTHPKVLAHEGDVYREGLHQTVQSLGLADAVHLDGRYLAATELAGNVAAADVVLLPYDSSSQVTSGVLAEAVAAGKPVVATAFPHAVELLSGGAGTVVPHRNPTAIAQALKAILEQDGVAARMAQAARERSRETSWRAIGARYRALAQRLPTKAAA